jgi:hypothetical protein
MGDKYGILTDLNFLTNDIEVCGIVLA